MFELTDFLPYLLNRAGSRIAESFSAYLKAEHGITLPMWRVLAALRHRDRQRVGALAKLTSIEVSTLSRLLNAMQRRGLVARHRPTVQAVGGDARAVEISLTEAGHRLSESIVPMAAHYEQVALAGFTAEEAESLKAMLARLYDNMAGLEAADERIAS